MQSPEIIAIAALTEGDRVIGNKGKVPWRIPADMERFKALTWGHAVIMGRHTWELDLEKRPLPGRHNIVVSTTLEGREDNSSSNSDRSETLSFAASLESALQQANHCDKVFIVGGSVLYESALPVTDTLELTLVETTHEGDTLFPAYQHLIGTEFKLDICEQHDGYRFETYRRIQAAGI